MFSAVVASVADIVGDEVGDGVGLGVGRLVFLLGLLVGSRTLVEKDLSLKSVTVKLDIFTAAVRSDSAKGMESKQTKTNERKKTSHLFI